VTPPSLGGSDRSFSVVDGLLPSTCCTVFQVEIATCHGGIARRLFYESTMTDITSCNHLELCLRVFSEMSCDRVE